MADGDFQRSFMDAMTDNAEKYDEILRRLSEMHDDLSMLGSIDESLKKIVNGNGFGSQSSARDSADSSRSTRDPFAQRYANDYGRRSQNTRKTFLDGFEKSLLDAFRGSTFKAKLQESLNKFAEAMGSNIEDLENDMGEAFGKMLANDFKSSKIGSKFTSEFEKFTDGLFGSKNGEGSDLGNLFKQMKEGKNSAGEDFGFKDFQKGLQSIDLGKFGNLFTKVGGKYLGIIEKFAGGTVASFVAMKMFQTAVDGGKRALEGFGDMLNVLKAAGNRYSESRQKNLEAANKRLKEDVETLIKEPFEILKKAADEVYQAWDSNIRLISGTQGYNKADLQDLMSAYAARLQEEGLSNVVATTEVYNNLAKVLQSGLTGQGAVRFAYEATRLNAAIPNQDFFSYVETYSSIAANAIAAGKSEQEALDIATASLDQFASSLLNADRNLTGGYSTALKAADSLYSSATRIAQAAKSENISGISDALLAIQGYVGAIAPDLATALSDKIYQLATGGNSADIVALRSLAGINASNTEFIKALASNPQQILSAMFTSLGKMYTQSPDAYMEKAEGYASLFGLSAEAFQRIDFMSLANAVSNMDNSTDNLEDNLRLLREGQSTTTAEQMKIAQINKYMVEEGLAYVVDNDAARMIQEHMWQEQQTRELTEAEYGVNLVGGAAAALNKIVSGIDKVLSILNPIAWFSKVAQVVETVADQQAEKADIKKVLELGKVGTGNASDLYRLTARNQSLELTRSLVEMMGGSASYTSANSSKFMKWVNGLGHPLEGITDFLSSAIKGKWGAGASTYTSGKASDYLPTSQYSWGSISKNTAQLASAMLKVASSTETVTYETVSQLTGAVSASVATMKAKVDRLMSDEYLNDKFVKQGKSYQEWLQSATEMGIADMEAAMIESGYDTAKVEEYYQAKQTEAGMQEKLDVAEDEKAFRTTGKNFWNLRFWEEHSKPTQSLLTTVYNTVQSMLNLQMGWRDSQLVKMQEIADNQINWKDYFDTSWAIDWKATFENAWTNWKDYFDTTWVEENWKTNFVGSSGLFTKFFDEFVKKFVENTYYNESGYKYEDVTAVQRQESTEKGNAVYALAEALTDNMVNLKDPQVQTNALLAQILVVVSAIMNQNNNVAGTTSLSDALTSLALGLTESTPLTETPVSNSSGKF